jgi:predicted  nucleic acid-binding Zn-ribbon protein
MNKERRKELEDIVAKLADAKTDLQATLEDAKEALQSVQADEQSYFDNMPESFQQADKGQAAENAIAEMQAAIDELETVIESINNAKG